MKVPVKLTKDSAKLILQNMETFLLDCDGVLWNGSNAISDAVSAVGRLKAAGKRVVLLTNNSTKSRQQYVQKCIALGFPITSEDDVLTTSYLCADYLSRQGLNGSKVYVIGSPGLGHELDRVNISHIGIGPDLYSDYTDAEMLYKVPLDSSVKAVVVGFDGHFSYPKMMKAASYLSCGPSCAFIGTNDDETIPSSYSGMRVPGTGSILASVVKASGRTPIVLGKPYPPMWQFLQRKFHIDQSKTIMIGDRCSTDIKFARTNGIASLLVLTGDTTVEKLEKQAIGNEEMDEMLIPDQYCDRLGSIFD